jgi:hypothetical protein
MIMGNLTKNFSSSEFECPCGCGESKMNSKFMTRLQTFRTVMDMPVSIVKGGGYLCKDYATSKLELHTTGRVAMPKIKSSQLFKAVNVAMSIGFTGIGIKNKNGSIQLHLDDAEGVDRPSIWTY